jgi:dTDP-glucose pyrophosphorylase
MNPAIVVMAAGLGSRFGGKKQLESVDDGGHFLMDYSLYDAYIAGFRKVVFIIKEEMLSDFSENIGKRVGEQFNVSYAFQNLDSLPDGFSVPSGRIKPWGTAHAVLSAAGYISEPFAVINADDYYGRDAFRQIYDFLICTDRDNDIKNKAQNMVSIEGLNISDIREYAMVGYSLKNTVSENGKVARGICDVSDDGYLKEITERIGIEVISDGKIAYYESESDNWKVLSPDTIVSMNLWGFTPDFITNLREGFLDFLKNDMQKNPEGAEYFLPSVVENMLKNNLVKVKVLRTDEKWYGMTYKEDLPDVKNALRKMREEGLYYAKR